MTYAELIAENKEKLIIECFKIINNSTLSQTYSIYTNLHSDYGISKTMLKSMSTSSKSKFKKQLSELKRLTGFKIRLGRTDNDSSYTRLIYRMENYK